MTKLPRLVLAAPTSGSGKTTLATGLMAALRQEGLAVSPHKVGPDYIDPSWHGAAAGRVGRNLDPMLVGHDTIPGLLLHGAHTPQIADIAIIEGVMGLFDGAIGKQGYGSTAHVAALTNSPIVLVVDASRTARSLAATIHGFVTFDPQLVFAGVIVNKVASARHEAEVRAAVEETGMPLLGVVPRQNNAAVGSRHLGLVTAAEWATTAETIDHMADLVREHCDLGALLSAAHRASPLTHQPWTSGTQALNAPTANVGMFGGKAFTFGYAEHPEMLTAAGATVTMIDPLLDEHLPSGLTGLVIGGGFPEMHLGQLSANQSLRAEIKQAIGDGMAVVAECAGLTYLCDTLDQQPMCGVIPAHAEMTKRLTIGYRSAVALGDNPLMHEGHRVIGHEFHRTNVTPRSGISLNGFSPAWGLAVDSGKQSHEGFATPTMMASYLHQHWAGDHTIVERFIRTMSGQGRTQR